MGSVASARVAWRAVFRRILPYLALAALSLIVLPSVFTPGERLCTAVDAPHFLYRLYEISWLADRGVLWPRWGPNLSYGYGYPVFHYYGSLSFYPSLLVHRLGATLLAAFQGGFWLAFLCSGWTAYLWLVSVLQDERAALIGAATYLYVPYHLNTVLYRWNLPEPWALAFAPLALYGLHRLSRRPDGRSVAVAALALAALPLTSNLATVVFIPVLLSYVLLLLATSGDRLRLLLHQAASGGLALALAAFFLVPAYLDRGQIQVGRSYAAGAMNVYHNFLPLWRAFWQPLFADVSRANPLYDPLSIGAIISGISLVVLAIRARQLASPLRWHAAWALLLALLSLWLCTSASEPLYRALPPMQVLQFPWRWLAPAMVLVSLLAGLASRAWLGVLSPRRAAPLALLATTIVLVTGWPLLYPGLHCEQSASPTMAEAVAAQEGMVGTLSTNAEYLPASVEEVPDLSPMFGDYIAGRPVVRWDQAQLPAGGQTLQIEDQGLWARWQVETPVAFDAIYQAFVFPGWQAMVDGEQVPIHAASPYGLIQFRVPAGRHALAVRFVSTAGRTASTIVSAAALLLTVALLVFRGRRSSLTRPVQFGWGSWLVATGIGVALLVLRLGLVDRFDLWPRVRRFDGEAVRGLAHPTEVAFSGGERLLGYELRSRPTSAGEPLDLDLYWATAAGKSFRAVVRLTDDQNKPWTGWDKIVHFTGLIGPATPRLWGPDHYTSMRYHVEVPLGTPPGTYNLTVAVLDPGSHTPRFVTAGVPVDAERTEAVVGQVTVAARQPKRSLLQESVAPQGVRLDGNGLALLGCETTMDEAFAGETVVIYPLWTTQASPDVDAFTVQLVDVAGKVALAEQRPLCPRYPPAQWQPGSVVRDRAEVLLPAHLSAGTYTWTLQVGNREAVVGTLDVRVPDRRWDVPGGIEPVGEVLDGFAELVGYRLQDAAPDQPVVVTLYWRVRQETATGYKVFLHMLDEAGQVIAQSDAVPADWTRPTTSWLPPEVIEDVHVLSVPPDLPADHRLVVGLYEPATGRRATTSTGADYITLETAQAEPRIPATAKCLRP
ncbi:MAG: 6-pyruvoyl-tetrahydropterin synthase-related protein [Anaerolineae bacterium]